MAKRCAWRVNQEITNIVPEAPIGNAGFFGRGDFEADHRNFRARRRSVRPSFWVVSFRTTSPSTTARVPFLGSIPGIGWLFRSESKSNTKRNLLIFLRPTVIRDTASANAVTQRKYEEIWEVEILVPGATAPAEPSELFDGRN